MSKKFTVLLAAIAIAAASFVAHASRKIDVDWFDDCIIGTGTYQLSGNTYNLTQYEIHTEEVYVIKNPGGSRHGLTNPGNIPAGGSVWITHQVPSEKDVEYTLFVVGHIVELDEQVSDYETVYISDHCDGPDGTPTNEPTATPTDTPTLTPTATFTPSETPVNTVTPGQTVIPTVTPTETATSQPTWTPVSEEEETPNYDVQQPTPSSTPIKDCEEECEIATCELGEDGHTTRYQSQVLEKTAYLQVRYDGIQVEGGSSHTTIDGLEVSMKHNVIENPYEDMVAAGGDISFFRGSCGHCLARWGNRRNPVTGEIELLFMDGSTKWDYMIAAGEILGLDVHNDFENVILRIMAEHASNLYAQREDASQSYIWVVIKD